MLGSGHVAGMFEEQRGGLCGWRGENRREEEVRDVEAGGLARGRKVLVPQPGCV